MKKKRFACLMTVCLVCMLSACKAQSPAGGHVNTTPTGVDAVLQSRMQEADGSTAEEITFPTREETMLGSAYPNVSDLYTVPGDEYSIPTGADGIDIDLTQVSSTVAFTEILTMQYYPEEYLGKTIKVHGTFNSFLDESTGKYYCACVIYDEAGCCTTGVEFALLDPPPYPEGFPEENSEITVVGVFQTYEENGQMYCTLGNAYFA